MELAPPDGPRLLFLFILETEFNFADYAAALPGLRGLQCQMMNRALSQPVFTLKRLTFMTQREIVTS
jgi:hypothetical protein